MILIGVGEFVNINEEGTTKDLPQRHRAKSKPKPGAMASTAALRESPAFRRILSPVRQGSMWPLSGVRTLVQPHALLRPSPSAMTQRRVRIESYNDWTTAFHGSPRSSEWREVLTRMGGMPFYDA